MSFPCQWCWCRSTRRDTRASGVAFAPRRVRVSTRLEPAGCGFQRVWDPAGLGFKLFETRRFRFSNKMAGFRRVTRLPGLPWIPGPCLGLILVDVPEREGSRSRKMCSIADGLWLSAPVQIRMKSHEGDGVEADALATCRTGTARKRPCRHRPQICGVLELAVHGKMPRKFSYILQQFF